MNDWIFSPVKAIDQKAAEKARTRQRSLTKPLGSLGELENIAESFACWQGKEIPTLQNIVIRIFAGDHGVYKQSISSYPQEVTAQMIQNFVSGGAAITVLSKKLGADFKVVNMGTVSKVDPHFRLINVSLAAGTNDFTSEAAMSDQTLLNALEAGKRSVLQTKTDLFIGGEMGIGNTTSASAIYSALLNLDPELTVGPGAGADETVIANKKEVIKKALALHADYIYSPSHHESSACNAYEILRCVGGLEIAALVGSYIACAQNGIPMVIDGFISTAAALIAVKLNPDSRNWMLFSHKSAEPAHELALETLRANPLLDLGMRLGEGSGAALAANIIISAIDLHAKMATFEQARVNAGGRH